MGDIYIYIHIHICMYMYVYVICMYVCITPLGLQELL
jgi:hypothetical protein